jgi:hypothetical protein
MVKMVACLLYRSDITHAALSTVRVIKSRMRWAGHVARVRKSRGIYRVLVWKTKGKRPLGRPRNRWEDNIKMDL